MRSTTSRRPSERFVIFRLTCDTRRRRARGWPSPVQVFITVASPPHRSPLIFLHCLYRTKFCISSCSSLYSPLCDELFPETLTHPCALNGPPGILSRIFPVPALNPRRCTTPRHAQREQASNRRKICPPPEYEPGLYCIFRAWAPLGSPNALHFGSPSRHDPSLDM